MPICQTYPARISGSRKIASFPSRVNLRPRILELAGQDAVVFLDEVDQNRLAPVLLAWTPLMQGGLRAETAERWADLSLRLGDSERRLAASLALTFSDLTDSRPVWKPLLESITRNESTYLREIRTEVRREYLTRALQAKLSGGALASAVARVEKQDDPAILSRWFDLALTLSPEALVTELNK